MKYLKSYIFYFLTIVLFSACSTEKNTLISRSYHNITSKYNIFFNGYESFKKGVEKAEKNIDDNYFQILPVFYFSDESIAQSVSSDMDRALAKATKVITLHSITAKPEMRKGPVTQKQKDFYNKKEFNKWIDKNLLLMGKSYVYKRQFNLALETFRRLITDFPAEKSRYEALIWMARAYNESNEFRESERILNLVDNDKDLPKKLRGDLYITYSDLYIKQGNYEKAIPWMEKGLKCSLKKKPKIRYTYILAQLYEETGSTEYASKKYREVIKMNPPYEMTFNAKINMASNFTSGHDDGRSIQTQLKKMLKDQKNTDYLDKIYYALGEVEMKLGNEEEALNYFRLSISSNSTNYFQKGQTYLTLGDIYFDRKEYPFAQAYYDSSLQYISSDFEKYDEFEQKIHGLKRLVENLNIYQLEDSLLMLASLSEQQRLVIVDQIIADLVKKEDEEKKQQSEEQTDIRYAHMMASQRQIGTSARNEEGKWYFYNLNAKSFGQPEFRMLWGIRKLEDNWRRKNKQSVESFFETAETTGKEDTTSRPVSLLSNKSREFYLQNIPLTDSMKKISQSRIYEALFNLGLIYTNEIVDKKKAVDSYEELLKRYPSGKYTHDAYYNLYELYTQLNEPLKAQSYHDLLVSGFPESHVVRMLTNPDFVTQLEKERQKEYLFYDETYNAFNKNEYRQVIHNADIALSSYKDSELLAQFSLLRALAIGGLNGPEMLKNEMEKLVKEFPGHKISDYAKEIIEHIYTSSPELKIADSRAMAEKLYETDNSAPHFCVLSAEKDLNQNQINFDIVNFNLDNYNELDLSIQRESVSGKIIYFIRSFPNRINCYKYMETLKKSNTVFRDIQHEKINIFMISEKNFNILMKDMDLGKYILFYENNYGD